MYVYYVPPQAGTGGGICEIQATSSGTVKARQCHRVYLEMKFPPLKLAFLSSDSYW